MQVANYYSHDIAELLRYTPVAVADSETFLQLADSKNVMESEGIFCKKCNFIKPLRTHHCSVCNKCVMLMDHHCMWTNNCIGLHNYKQFLQLCGFAEISAFYTSFIIWCLEDSDFYMQSSGYRAFYTFSKFWDLLIGKAMMAFFGWNLYIASTGLTYIEYKNAMELTYEAANDTEKKKVRRLMKFNYAFGSMLENWVRVFQTANPLTVFFFTDWGEDERLKLNGTEWTTFYYFGVIQDINHDYLIEAPTAKESDQASHPLSE